MADVSIADLNKTLKDENTKKLKADREEAAKQRSKLDQVVNSLKKSGIDTESNKEVNKQRAKLEKIDFQIKLRGVKDREERKKLLDE